MTPAAYARRLPLARWMPGVYAVAEHPPVGPMGARPVAALHQHTTSRRRGTRSFTWHVWRDEGTGTLVVGSGGSVMLLDVALDGRFAVTSTGQGAVAIEHGWWASDPDPVLAHVLERHRRRADGLLGTAPRWTPLTVEDAARLVAHVTVVLAHDGLRPFAVLLLGSLLVGAFLGGVYVVALSSVVGTAWACATAPLLLLLGAFGGLLVFVAFGTTRAAVAAVVPWLVRLVRSRAPPAVPVEDWPVPEIRWP